MWAVHKRLTAIFLSLVVGLTTCNREQNHVAPKSELNAAEYEAFSAYVAGKFTAKKQAGQDTPKVLIILDTTASGDDDLMPDENGRAIPWEKTAESLRKKSPSLQKQTIDAFRKANAQQASLRPSFRLPVDYELVDATQLDSIFKNNREGWLTYYRRFPGAQGVLTLSRAGFSGDGTQALFYWSNRCGGLCGAGMYVVLEKSNGRWVTAKEIQMWMS